MEYRSLGKFWFEGAGVLFRDGYVWGGERVLQSVGSETSQEEANRSRYLYGGRVNLFDTADMYSDGESEKMLGKAIAHLKREDVLISTKATFRLGNGPNDVGSRGIT